MKLHEELEKVVAVDRVELAIVDGLVGDFGVKSSDFGVEEGNFERFEEVWVEKAEN